MENKKKLDTRFILIVVVIVGAVVALSLIFGPTSQPQNSDLIDTLASPQTTKREDSLIAAYRVEENKAIGDIEFGINQKMFDKKIEKFNKANGHKDVNGYTEKTIGNYVYFFAKGLFYQNKLYEVDISGDGTSYEHYNSELKDKVAALYKMISTKYGASQYGTGPIEFHKTEKGYSYLAYGWHIGSKDVEIRIRCNGEFYSPDLQIFQPSVAKLIEESAQKTTDSLAKKAAQSL